MKLRIIIRSIVFTLAVTGILLHSIPPVGDLTAQISDDSIPESTEDPGKSTVNSVNSTKVENKIHERVNKIRSSRNLSTLEYDEKFAGYGRAHSYDMNEREFFAHENPDGESPADRIPNVFEKCQMVGENLHYRTYSNSVNESEIANKATNAWMNSKDHRKNLLRSEWDFEGIGVYIGEQSDGIVVYSSQEFCEY